MIFHIQDVIVLKNFPLVDFFMSEAVGAAVVFGVGEFEGKSTPANKQNRK